MGCVVGIDLGTTYSALARVNEAGMAEIIANDEGDKITPSVVLFDGGTPIVGQIAREALSTEPGHVVQLVKRQMGSSWTYMSGGVEFHPQHISALILKKVVLDAEREIGPIDAAVITVPAYFNEAKKNATKEAGEIAGLTVLGLINEPTAAAVAFSLREKLDNATLLVFDLGGGTFDVTIMKAKGDDLRVVASGGDNYLGGANFDKKLYDHFVEQFNKQFRINLEDPQQVDYREAARLGQDWLKKAERLKRDLTLREKTSASLTAMGQTMRIEVTRAEFESMTAVLVQETEDKVRSILDEADVSIEEIDRILLVGGSTRMPMIRERVTSIFGKAADSSVNPDEAVALGAAFYATNLVIASGGDVKMPAGPKEAIGKKAIIDVASHSIGVQAFDGPPERGGRLHNVIMLPRWKPLPISGEREFYTSRPNQTSITIEVLEGERSEIEYCQRLGKLNIDGLPGGRGPDRPILVTMSYDTNGMLEVSARDLDSNRMVDTKIERQTPTGSDAAASFVKHMAGPGYAGDSGAPA